MKILMISSECVPFAKAGGLADMVGALSSELSQQGEDVRILMPYYAFMDAYDFRFLASVQIDMKHRKEDCDFLETTLPASKAKVYGLKSQKYFDRKGLYGPTASTSYPDNAHRYSLLSHAFIELCRTLDWYPDILHSHDWPSGLVPVYKDSAGSEFEKSGTVFSIHNMGYQGFYTKQDLPWLGITVEEAKDRNMMKDNYINFLKCGIENNNTVSTVSKGYAQEIQTLPYGHGLDQSLRHRSEDLWGIINGVDYTVWNPENDPYIAPDFYSYFDMNGKARCKSRLQMEMGLEVNPEKAVFSIISRLVEQKGIEELCKPGVGILEDFCNNQNIQFIILGTGEQWCEDELMRLSATLPNLSVKITYNEGLSHLIEAGSDFFVMPSRYEPCGLNQLYSLKYGTIPVVRRTGGLADTVKDPEDVPPEQANGFVYDKACPEDLLKALNRALDAWNEPAQMKKMRFCGMREDFSWNNSRKEYMELYKATLLTKSNPGESS